MEKIAVIGLGYVGLPLAVALARAFSSAIGFDISSDRVTSLRNGLDKTGEVSDEELGFCKTTFTDNPDALKECTFFIVTVPTPVQNSGNSISFPRRAEPRAYGFPVSRK